MEVEEEKTIEITEKELFEIIDKSCEEGFGKDFFKKVEKTINNINSGALFLGMSLGQHCSCENDWDRLDWIKRNFPKSQWLTDSLSTYLKGEMNILCQECGKEVNKDSKFCSECGHKL